MPGVIAASWQCPELEGVNKLWHKNLISYTRVTSLEREKERLEGERGKQNKPGHCST